jgi:hypothetical protein
MPVRESLSRLKSTVDIRWKARIAYKEPTQSFELVFSDVDGLQFVLVNHPLVNPGSPDDAGSEVFNFRMSMPGTMWVGTKVACDGEQETCDVPGLQVELRYHLQQTETPLPR